MTGQDSPANLFHFRDFLQRRWLDMAWLLVMLVVLTAYLLNNRSLSLCAQMGTDFRGYYSSAVIARQHGFARVYDTALQDETQRDLLYRCPGGKREAGLRVAMPYLPVYVLLFLPLTALDFTQSYLIFTLLNVSGLALYLVRFARAMQVPLGWIRLLQWVTCLPALTNLFLGQMNLLLVISLGEFMLTLVRGQEKRSGLWLGVMLMKPNTLILLLPGLLISRRWRILLGFGAGAAAVLGASLLLGGVQGLLGSSSLAARFAGPLIQTVPGMMNWRGLAVNLESLLPAWIAWGVAAAGMILTAGVVLYLWLRHPGDSPTRWVLLILATFTGSLAITWHAHFYLLMLLIPLLTYLDGRRWLPDSVLAPWLLAPPMLYVLGYLLNPALVRNIFGMGMLALDLVLLAWASTTLRRTTD